MKRNVVLFGASLAVGVAASAGLIAGGTASSAATNAFAGYAYTDALGSSGWATGAFTIDSQLASGSASAGASSATGSVTFIGATKAGVTTTCNADGSESIKVTGPAAGTYKPGKTMTLAEFSGSKYAIGTVTFGTKTIGGYTVGAYIDISQLGTEGNYLALTGAKCSAATTPPTTTPPTSTSTPTGTSTSTPTGTSTSTPTGSPTGSPTTAPTEPPTPTPTTTTLPVTG